MPLSGVYEKCQGCTQDCKQYEQVTVVFCPMYVSESQGIKRGGISTQGKKSNLPQVER